MGADLISIGPWLKQVYGKKENIVKLMVDDDQLLNEFQKSTVYQAGEEAIVPLHTSRNTPTMMGERGGVLNPAGSQSTNRAKYRYKQMQQPVQIDESSIERSNNDTKAIADIIDLEMTGAMADVRKHLKRVIAMDGSGQIAQCGTTSNTNVVALNATSGGDALERGWLYAGMPIDIGTSSDEDAIIADAEIVSVDDTAGAPTITISSNVNTTSSHYVSIANSRKDTTSFEANGLKNIVSTTTTVGDLAPATEPKWKASYVDTTSQDLTLDLLLLLDRKIKQNSGKKGDMILTSLAQEANFYQLLQQQVEFSSDKVEAGNVESAKWRGLRVMGDVDIPNGDLYLFVKRHFLPLASREPFWSQPGSGESILQWLPGTTYHVAKLGYHYEFGVDDRRAFARLSNLTT